MSLEEDRRSAADFLLKLAALTDKENAAYKDTLRRHAEFDRIAATGKMTPEQKESMRHNVKRIEHFKAKKSNDGVKIPSWASDPKGKPPSASSGRWSPPSSGPRTERPNMHSPSGRGSLGRLAGGIALAGAAAYGIQRHMKQSDEERKMKDRERKKKDREGGHRKAAFATNEFSGPMNPNIQSGASVIPPFKRPGLAAPVEKTAKRYKIEGDAVIEVGKDGKSLGKGPIKLGAGAPTRGNFMMASDVPPMKVPSLRAPVEKNSEMFPEYMPYSSGDFAPASLRKKASFSTPVQQQASAAKRVGLPHVSAPPGPSIEEIAKPKGPGMGSGIAGAFKGSIGGTAGVSMK